MFLKNSSINKRLTLINTSIILLALTLLTTISYLYIRHYTIEKTRDYESRLLSQISSNIDDQLEEIDLHTYGVLTNVRLKRTLEYYNRDVTDKLSTIEIESLLMSTMFARRDIASIELFDLGGNHYNTSGINIYSQKDFKEMYEKAVAAKGKLVYLPTASNNIIQAVRLISSFRLEPVGVVVFNLRQSIFQDVLEKGKGDSRGEIILLDNEQTVIAATNKELVNVKTDVQDVASSMMNSNKERYISTEYSSRYNDWKYIHIISEDNILKDIKTIRLFLLFFLLVVFVIFSIVTYLFAKSISNPIKQMTDYIKKTEIEGWTPNVISTNNDEVYYLNHAFNAMMEELKNLYTKVYREELLKEKHKFKSLQAQVNPHFLYNTLDLINWSARSRGLDDIGTIVKSLSTILRYSLDHSSDEVDLEEELEYIDQYLSIQKYRYGDKLNVRIHIDDRIFNQSIIRLTIQPIIENSFKHGFSNTVDRYELDIEGGIQGDYFYIVVTDNGKGLSEGELVEIVDMMKEDNNNHIGLANVNDRIKIRYGSKYGLNIERVQPHGTRVTIKLPLS